MFRAFAAVAAAIGVVGMAVTALPAQAATLADTAFLDVGGFRFSWEDFDCTPSGGCANTQVLANVSGDGIELVPLAGTIVSAGQDITAFIRIDSLTGAAINSYSVVTAGGTVVSPAVPGSVGVSLYSVSPFAGISGTNTTTSAGSTSVMPITTSPPRTSVVAGLDIAGNGGTVTRVGITVTAVPEPATALMFAAGLVGLAALRRRTSA